MNASPGSASAFRSVGPSVADSGRLPVAGKVVQSVAGQQRRQQPEKPGGSAVTPRAAESDRS
jgi:hypothetical protein